MRRSIFKKYGSKNKQSAARAAVSAARAAIISARRGYAAPLSRRGFYGQWNRPGQLGPELKTIDVNGFTNFTTAGSVLLLNGVATGTDYNTRVGRKIRLISLLFRLSTDLQAPNPGGEIFRIMLVYDTQANGVAPTIANILQQSQWDSPINLDNRDRFKVLLDKMYTSGANNYAGGAITTGNFTPVNMKRYQKLNLDVNFSGTAATIGSIATGSIYMLLMSANTSSTVLAYYNSRIRFIDT